MEKPDTTKRYNEEEVFKLYFEYDGNVHAMLKDPKCTFGTYHALYMYIDKKHFQDRLNEIHNISKKQTNEELAGHLVIKRMEIIGICRAIFARYANQLADTKKLMKVTSKDLNTAYKIFKNEMGEAAEISRHEFSSVITGEEIFDHFLKRAEEEKIKAKEREENNAESD